MSNYINAEVRDISAYASSSGYLEVSFDTSDGEWLPDQHKGELIIEIHGKPHIATVGIKPSNRIYLHSRMKTTFGHTRWREVLRELGCKHGDALRFEVVEPRRKVRLSEVLRGEGPPPRPGPRPQVRQYK